MATDVRYFPLFFKATFLCLLLSASFCSGDLFGSLRFTRDALFGFSRVDPNASSPLLNLGRSSFKQKQPQRYRPSNKFLEIMNEVEKAVVKAMALDSQLRYKRRLPALMNLLRQSIRSKSYNYARDVFGKVMHVLINGTKYSRREKRSRLNAGESVLRKYRKFIGEEAFDRFMAVQGEVSLMFVVDDTASMSSEIEAVKKTAIAVASYPREAPVEYILSPFNDPMTDAGQVVIKQDGEAGEFVQAINALSAHSGGDCPEYTFQGILNALGQRQGVFFGSPMYVFTDADPKDADENIELVKGLAIADDVQINFFSTGSCGGKLHPAFLKLSKDTSGKALLLKEATEVEKLQNVMEGALEGTTIIRFGSSLLGRKKRSSSESPSRYRFPVDDSIETMIISVETTRRDTNGRGITLSDPTGTIVTAEKVILSQIALYTIRRPAQGHWTLEILGQDTGEHEFYVKSSSETNIDFKHYFVIPLGRGRWKLEEPFAKPISGKLNKMVLNLLSGEGKVNSGSLRLQITTESGAVVRNLNLIPRDNTHYVASFTPPTTPFRLKLIGITQRGHTFERMSRRTIEPTTAVLRGKYASNDFTLPLNVITFMYFQICNFAASELFEIVSRKDVMGYILHPSASSQRPKYVGKDRCTMVFVRAKATRLEDVNRTDTVIVVAKGQSSGVVISQVMRLFVVNP